MNLNDVFFYIVMKYLTTFENEVRLLFKKPLCHKLTRTNYINVTEQYTTGIDTTVF